MTVDVQSTLLRATMRTHEEAVHQLEDVVAGMSDAQANWKPGPDAWSLAECIDHLNQTLVTYMDQMSPAIARARDHGISGGEPYGRGTLAGRFLISFLKSSAKKARAPRVFRPRDSELALGTVCESFRRHVSRFVELAEQADGLALGRINIATPVSGWIRVSLAQAFEIHGLHTPRHLAQAERLVRGPGFPAA